MVGDWSAVEELPPLVKSEVQVWRIELPETETPTERFVRLLSEEEQVRAQRLRAGRVRLQFVAARACLRTLLGNALATDPKLVPIVLSSYGKPETAGVFFNVAHSGATILIALCRRERVGVDIEYFSRETDMLAIAKNSFAEGECRALSAIDDVHDLRHAFFRCWTRKEAIVKADGRGLSVPLDSFEVPVGGMAAMTRVCVPESAGQTAGEYYLADLDCGTELAASIATVVPNPMLQSFLFPLRRTL